MKKLLVLAAVLCCTFGLFAKFGEPKPELIQLTFGVGAADLNNDSNNQLGISVGADIDWNVWEKATTHAHDGSGKMYAGLDLAAQWWMPTKEGFDHHWVMIPIQGNFMYLFDTTQMKGAGPLKAVGPWISMGVGLNVPTWKNEYDVDELDDQGNKVPETDKDGKPKLDDKGNPIYKKKHKTESKGEFAASFAWGIGVQLNFNNNWGLKAGFGGNAGGDKWFWHSHDYFMAEAAYRF